MYRFVLISGLMSLFLLCLDSGPASAYREYFTSEQKALLEKIQTVAVEALALTEKGPADAASLSKVLSRRLKEIRGGVTVHPLAKLYTQDSRAEFDWTHFDYVIDAIDSVDSKIDLLMYAKECGCTVFCSLGAAGKLDPTLVRATSIWKTSGCPLGRLVRTGLRNRNFTGDFTAVYSEEHPREGYCVVTKEGGKPALGSFVAVTAAFGMTLASLVVRDIEARANKKAPE